MDIYRYVNRRNYSITVGGITIPASGEHISYNQTVPALDRVDGVLVDKHFNGAFRQEPVEFNYYQPVVSNTKGDGIKLNSENPQFGWYDLLSPTTIYEGASANKPNFEVFVGTIRAYQFAIGDESFHEFHIPHDYVPGTDVWIHAHWTYNGPVVTGGSVTWQWDASMAPGYGMGVYNEPISVSTTQAAPLVSLTHMIASVKLSSIGGSGGLLNTNLIEPDTLIKTRLTLAANTMTDAKKPFMSFSDMHYQSSNIATKNPIRTTQQDFWS